MLHLNESQTLLTRLPKFQVSPPSGNSGFHSAEVAGVLNIEIFHLALSIILTSK